MSELDVLRKDIDRLDKEIAELLLARFAVVKEIGEVKKRENIPVTNTGSCDADEVVQLYVRRPADVEGPLKSLRGFQRVSIPAGKTVQVVFPLTGDTFLNWSPEAGDMVPTKGEWELLYGGSSADSALKRLPYKH